MNYKIIEVHMMYKENQVSEIAVLWQSNPRGWVRASYITTDPSSGYYFIKPDDFLSPELIQKVAGKGMNLPDEKKKIYFPGKRMWEQ